MFKFKTTMAKKSELFDEPFEDTLEKFNQALADTGLEQNIQVQIMVNNKLKTLYKVSKANDVTKHLTGNDVIILLNEKVFEVLEDEQKSIVIDEILAKIYFNPENSKIKIINPDVQTTSLLLNKYSYEKYERLLLSTKSLLGMQQNAA